MLCFREQVQGWDGDTSVPPSGPARSIPEYNQDQTWWTEATEDGKALQRWWKRFLSIPHPQICKNPRRNRQPWPSSSYSHRQLDSCSTHPRLSLICISCFTSSITMSAYVCVFIASSSGAARHHDIYFLFNLF